MGAVDWYVEGVHFGGCNRAFRTELGSSWPRWVAP